MKGIKLDDKFGRQLLLVCSMICLFDKMQEMTGCFDFE